jgi:hypothetical protein
MEKPAGSGAVIGGLFGGRCRTTRNEDTILGW